MQNKSVTIFTFLFFVPIFLYAVDAVDRPDLETGRITEYIDLDGLLNEADWNKSPFITDMKTVEPVEGAQPSSKTVVKVLANKEFLIIGAQCFDDDPGSITRFSKLRDQDLRNEDHIRIVIDPSQDGQSGYIFMVNAYGARYDALVSNRGERENDDWDAIWEAASTVNTQGWSTEIKIPIQSLNFKKGLREWGFNVERRVQRNLETIRWANARQDQWFTQTSKAGLITHLPEFDYGIGLNIRPSAIIDVTRSGNTNGNQFSFNPSLDIGQKIGSNIIASITVNTDFAETEVDSRQTNLTRFPLFFPEKRTFFLEGADIFEFGLGLGREMIPFFTRSIGLYEEKEIPISFGSKVNGRIGDTAFGALSVVTRSTENNEFSIPNSTMGVFRVRQNILGESSLGLIGTLGDPSGVSGNWLSGIDFTYQTTSFRGNKNFLAGVWGLYANSTDLEGNQSAIGFKVDYPNDLWDMSLTYMRIGNAFNPSLGFVPRNNINYLRAAVIYSPRPSWSWLRQMRNEFFFSYYSTLDDEWETYRFFTAPINWRLESGDRIEFNINPEGENLMEPFEISEGVVIPVGKYHFIRYRLEASFAAKRRFNGQASWWFGSFYDGVLHQMEGEFNWNVLNILSFEFIAQKNIARLPYGEFDQTLLGTRVRFNVTTDLQINSFIQYDTDTRTLGINTRVHWIFHPQGDFFIVYNHNVFKTLDRWQLETRQLLIKFRYNFRM